MKLLPNTIEGLAFGLRNFDAVETDVRLTRDGGLAIHHDPNLVDGRFVRELKITQLRQLGIPSLEDVLNDERIKQLLKEGRKIWLESKPDCRGGKSIHDSIAQQLHDTIVKTINDTNTSQSSFRMLGFQKVLLQPYIEDDIRVYFIRPYVNECRDRFLLLRVLPRLIRKSSRTHILEAAKDGYDGVLFAREYLFGPISHLNPNYDELCDLMDETGLEIGTNLGTPDLEHEYRRFHRFSDKTQHYPRHAKPGEGMIIAHRGTGTKGVIVNQHNSKA